MRASAAARGRKRAVTHAHACSRCRLASHAEVAGSRPVPRLLVRPLGRTQLCRVCGITQASHITLGDKLTDDSPFPFCEACFHAAHYDETGKLLYSDFLAFPAPAAV